MSKTKVAVIGAGHLGRIHTRLISSIDSVDLVAVVDPSPAAQKQVLELMDVQVLSDFHKILDSIDAAIIATPTRFHFDVAAACLENGIHTLIEKPMTHSSEDAVALVELAKQHECVVQVGHVERFNAAIRQAASIVGQPKFVQAERLSGYTYRSTDIGVVHDLMIHDIDLVNSFFPGEVNQVHANGISVLGENEDIAQARIQFDCGGVASLTASRCSFEPSRKMQIFGTDGYALVDLANHSVKAVRVPSWVRNREFDFLNTTPQQQAFVREHLFESVLSTREETIEPVNAILCEQQDWLDAIHGRSQPMIDAQAGCEAVQVAEQVICQINNHRWSALDLRMTGALAEIYPASTASDPIPAGLAKTVRRAA